MEKICGDVNVWFVWYGISKVGVFGIFFYGFG